jgi:hypothetical protein
LPCPAVATKCREDGGGGIEMRRRQKRAQQLEMKKTRGGGMRMRGGWGTLWRTCQ